MSGGPRRTSGGAALGCPAQQPDTGRTAARTVFAVATDPELGVHLKRIVGARSMRSLAEQTGWGRSTIHEWLSGTRLPSDSQLDDLLDAVNAPQDQRLELHRIRNVVPPTHVEEPAPDEVDGALNPTPTPPPRRRGWALPVLAGVLALALFGGGYALGRTGSTDGGVSTHVAQTLGKGVFTRKGPSTKTEEMGSLFDGNKVTVVCLAPNGDAVNDTAQGKTRTVWALLSTGVWIPDLYLDTPKNWTPPQPPPAPLSSC